MFFRSVFARPLGAPSKRRLAAARDRAAESRRLQDSLLCERSRADRTGSEFCLVQFPVQPDQPPAVIEQLPSRLHARARITDVLGRRPDGGVWLVLVDCCVAEAERLVGEVGQGLRRPLDHSIHHYPTSPVAMEHDDTRPDDPPGSPRPLENCFESPTPLWKRLLDVVGAGVGLMVAAPLMLTAAVLIKLDSSGPVLFAQQRSGRLGRTFTIYKFRSMMHDAEQRKHELRALNEQDGPAFKIERDPRVTRTGRLLRATSLDELPQLWNVLLGEMSLVGPRPLPVEEARRCVRWQRRRWDVTPGLTCIWQVKNRRTKISFDDWVRMDLRYIRERSLWIDLKLIQQTAAFVLRRGGV